MHFGLYSVREVYFEILPVHPQISAGFVGANSRNVQQKIVPLGASALKTGDKKNNARLVQPLSLLWKRSTGVSRVKAFGQHFKVWCICLTEWIEYWALLP